MNAAVQRMLEELRHWVTEFIYPLQTTREINLKASDRMQECALALVRLLKHEELLPRSVLIEIRVVAGVLSNEAPYFGEHAATLEEIARNMEYFYQLILGGEVPEDRAPGVPRII